MLEKALKNLTPEQQEELLGRIIVEEARLLEGDPTSVTDIEGQGSFVSIFGGQHACSKCNVM